MKVLVTGNCQARPISDYVGAACGAEMLPPVVLHLANANHESEYRQILEQADLIFAQRTDPSFRPECVASHAILASYPNKTFTWPNIFYAGQQPYLRYMTSSEHGRINSPLESYHDLRIVRKWMASRGGPQIGEGGSIDAIHEISINLLRKREIECSVGIADLIEAHRSDRRLFFTFNHPTRWLLLQVGARLCAAAGLPFDESLVRKGEPLSRIVPPSVWHSWPDGNVPLRGPTVSRLEGPAVGLGPLREYSPAELEAAFFSTYDHIHDWIVADKVRFTPDYGVAARAS